MLVASTLALGVSTSARSDEPAPCGARLSPEDAMRRLNDLRLRGVTCRRAGEPMTAAPLSWSDSLATVAQLQAREMALLDRMGHRDREDRALAQRLRALGYRFSAAVENVAVGYPSLDDVVEAWLESEGHCDNLMNAAVLEFGLACTDVRNSGPPEERRYWTLVLGAPARCENTI